MHRPAYGNLPPRRHAGRAASSVEEHSPTRLKYSTGKPIMIQNIPTERDVRDGF